MSNIRTAWRWALALGLGLGLGLGLAQAAMAQTAIPDGDTFTGRTVEALTDGWRFHKGDAADAAATGFDDSGWTPVTLPHTWNATDGQDGGNDYYRGPGWYRRPLMIPTGEKRRHFLRFNAASIVADVFVDGQKVGQHRGAFGAFCFEITPLVRAGQRHTLAVRVDNELHEDIAPLSGDFTMFGGLYRSVELLTTGEVCISPLDYGSSGVYLSVKRIDDAAARVLARTIVSNAGSQPRSIQVYVTAYDAQGLTCAGLGTPKEALPGDENDLRVKITIPKPRRWDGRRDPYLYRVAIELRDGVTLLDRVEQPLGLRTFKLDPETGFHLNGRPLDLHGVSRHQDRAQMGWAITGKEISEDFEILDALGCTAVRLAHYQHAHAAYAEADRLGMVVWAEIPLIDQTRDTDAFRDNARQQLRELIRQNYNHPSICFWGIHNEVTAPWKQPAPDPTATVKMLNQLAKQEDADRLTVSAGCDPEEHPANWVTDAIAFNRYFGWYVGSPDDFAPWADRMRREHADRPIGVSEYGGGGSVRHHVAWPPTKPKHNGPWHPEEWQSLVHETHWRAMASRPFIWGEFVWNGFDFASDGRNEGDAKGINDKGLVTHDRRVRKDAWYWYQANWSDQPMTHITSARWTPRPAGPQNVRVYSNCDEVELSLNGESLGIAPVTGHVATWAGVDFVKGTNTLQAIGRRGSVSVQDQATIVGE